MRSPLPLVAVLLAARVALGGSPPGASDAPRSHPNPTARPVSLLAAFRRAVREEMAAGRFERKMLAVGDEAGASPNPNALSRLVGPRKIELIDIGGCDVRITAACWSDSAGLNCDAYRALERAVAENRSVILRTMADPSWGFCTEMGGIPWRAKGSGGGECALCFFPDGSAVDTWSLYRARHASPRYDVPSPKTGW